MAHHVEPMDVDSDFDNKENSLHHNNVLPFTEKGYDELDVSELNMKLRYSVTPASSPMSKSYTANCFDNRSLESGDDSVNITVNENVNLTRSLNSTMTKNDNVLKSLKVLPLKTIHTDQYVDSNRNNSVLRPLESTVSSDNANITVTVNAPSDIDENLSLPSSSSSTLQTPEATTPTKDIPLNDGGSPIMRGLKSVFSMFRSSQSPIPPAENESLVKPTIISNVNEHDSTQGQLQAVLASTPIAAHRKKELSPTKRSSPQKEINIVFNEDLEKELQWKDETTIIFSQERIPIHKLMFQQQDSNKIGNKEMIDTPVQDTNDLNSTVEYMDISNNSIRDTTVTNIKDDNMPADSTLAAESDTEFVDCETTFTKSEDNGIEDANTTPVGDTSADLNITQVTENKNKSGSRLKQIILDTTLDILNATLSVKPEDLLPEVLDKSKHISPSLDNNATIELSKDINVVVTLEEDPNATKVLLEMSTRAADETFEATNSDVFQDKDLEITQTEESTFNETLKGDKDDQNLNTTIREPFSLDSKSIDVQVSSPVDQLNNILEIDLNKTKPISSADVNEHCVSSTTDPTSSKHTTEKSLSNEIEVNTVREPSENELPVDIPLPDEDDLDKELILSSDITTPAIPENQPLDLVDDIKLLSEFMEPLNTLYSDVPLTEAVQNTVNDFSPTTAIVEDNSYVNSQTTNLHHSIITEPHDIVKENNENTDDSEHANEIKNVYILPEVSLLYSRHANECENVRDATTIDNEINVINNVNTNFVLETNDNGCNFEPLPYIVNQTIAISNTDNIKPPVIVSEVSTLEEMSDNDNISNKTIDLGVQLHGVNEIEAQISSVNQSQPINIAVKEKKELTLTSDFNTYNMDNLPNDMNVTCTINDNIEINNSRNNSERIEETYPINKLTQTVTENITSVMEDQDEVAQSTTALGQEVVLSGNNSPFTFVEAIETEPKGETELKNLLAPETKVVCTPPNSPPIQSKGYNFNFDDLAFEAFATKTNIGISPPFNTPKKRTEANIQPKTVEKPIPKKDTRRKTQSDRKKPTTPKTKLNSTYHSSLSDITTNTCTDNLDIGPAEEIQVNPPDTIGLNPNNEIIDEILVNCTSPKTKEKLENVSEIVIKSDLESSQMEKTVSTECNESSDESNINQLKGTSSSEQSTYGTASDSSIPSRNVFNLPEIDDMNFNPFTTKSKMRESPPPSPNVETNCAKISSVSTLQLEEKVFRAEDKVENELMEKDASGDLTSTTISSKATDERNVTPKEIHTEDEDTMEGPFLEVDDLNSEDKMSEFDDENIDMMQFNEIPPQSNEENLDNGEMFIDAEAFEFLLNQNKTSTVVDSGKESLFLKFDPLFAKRMSAITSDGVVASLAKLQNRQSTPTKLDQSSPNSMPVAGPSNLNETQDIDVSNAEDSTDDINITISKPMMVVPPAVNPVTPRNKSITPNRSNRRSITFTSPAMAVIDRLLSLSGNTSALYDTTITQVSREQNEADIALSQLRELLAEKEINVYNLRSESNELKDRLNTLESHVRSLETESQDRLKKINDLNETLVEKTKINRSMAAVVEEYERTIASLIAETAQDKKRHAEERIKLINERDEQTAHLASMEVSFSDLHSKYEKSKQIILNCKANEETYKKSIKEFEENFTKMQNNYELLKQHATSKLNRANQEMEKINRAHEAEVLKLNAMIKRKELHITSLEESLIQKTKANEELTAICDELINKVG
ncbi:unnamed protein product [Arctia plantaginis]|uniref:Transforming acidic coiled-coil-containing protein C-terminal domain-containing protein n=1 Tax=Arctia plantaginis TaxID=874455 RepID=A0A8S1ALQ0_ARCPL|nr:unnamed protein product [Arctia plantaginis]